jgi:glycosyltransferase involved in cell wall biosynthesis
MEPDRVILQVAASRFFGGPERQILDLARELAPQVRTVFACFSEGGRCRQFLEEVRQAGFQGIELNSDTPHLLAALRELAATVQSVDGSLLLCNGYKADILGLAAGRRLGIPVVSVAHGWTGESLRVRIYEAIDRRVLRWMDKVVCVSGAQAAKVGRNRVPPGKMAVIRNAIRAEQFPQPDPAFRVALEKMFPRKPRIVVGAAGRLSPEKGFAVLIDAARLLAAERDDVGFVLFGEGQLRRPLESQIARYDLQDRFVLAGFTDRLHHYLPHFDLLTLPSYSEGLPVIVLEAFAAGVPVVATAVGGCPEVVVDQDNGFLVPPGDAGELHAAIRRLIEQPERARQMGQAGRSHVREHFTFAAQAESYRRLFAELIEGYPAVAAPPEVLIP